MEINLKIDIWNIYRLRDALKTNQLELATNIFKNYFSAQRGNCPDCGSGLVILNYGGSLPSLDCLWCGFGT